MKLAIIVTVFPSVTETFIVRDVKKFMDAGHDVRVFHLAPYSNEVVVHDFAKDVTKIAETRPFVFGANVVGALWRAVIHKPRQLCGIVFRIIAACWREPVYMLKSLAIVPKSLCFAESLEKWGVDHVHGEFAGHPATSAWIIGRIMGAPFSFSCRAHDIFVTQALLDEKIAESAFIRTVSNFNIAFLADHVRTFDSKKAFVVHSSIDLAEIKTTPMQTGDTFHVLYVGSLEQRKGVDNLLVALSQTQVKMQCRIIGEGPDRAKLQKLTETLGLTDQVTFLGAQPYEEVAHAYQGADVVVVPSKIGKRGRTEGIPNVVIEALGHGRPVITSRVSGIPELVRDGEQGILIEPGDVEALTRALDALCGDRAMGARMAAAGRKAVEAEFDLTQNVARQLAYFAQHSTQPGANT